MKNKIITLAFVLFSFLLAKSQVGINTVDPGSTLDVRGSFATPYKQTAAISYSFLETDEYLDYRGTAAAAWSLPAAVASPATFGGRIYEIRNGSAFDVTITPEGSERIDVSNVATAQASLTIPAGYYVVIKNTGLTSGTTWVVTLLTSGNIGSSGSFGFSTSILGYIPVKASQRAVPAIFGGVSVSEKGCKKWSGIGANGHTYCAYQLGGGKNFYDTFSFAKQVGGYVVTMTSNAERTFVNTNILTGYTLNNNIWIGYNKVAYPGNSTEFTWITGEDWTIDWTTSPNSTPQSFFASGEPNNGGGTEGSCHIYNTAGSASRQWNDLSGSSTNFAGSVFDQVILEFNED
ncbi:C-type lectin domain-containing protein [Chryseobacterium viscerum]|uniref:C-type lectin domain-containing protein n=1 Tax=Chryseobacterium viscerum TaxID=1037377 RepID=A0A316WHQ2_9FLAO|nr:C-type lectin domain-containing protein [Chryseobacterium viscerum]PWN57990.1 hypothetical protein C1634_024940 [Chryseobacterium viscerum]